MALPFRNSNPPALWIGLGVVGVHALVFALVWDKHFMPKVPPPGPTPMPVNFGARQWRSVDPKTGEATVEHAFVVSTKLVSPPPSPTVSRSP